MLMTVEILHKTTGPNSFLCCFQALHFVHLFEILSGTITRYVGFSIWVGAMRDQKGSKNKEMRDLANFFFFVEPPGKSTIKKKKIVFKIYYRCTTGYGRFPQKFDVEKKNTGTYASLF